MDPKPVIVIFIALSLASYFIVGADRVLKRSSVPNDVRQLQIASSPKFVQEQSVPIPSQLPSSSISSFTTITPKEGSVIVRSSVTQLISVDRPTDYQTAASHKHHKKEHHKKEHDHKHHKKHHHTKKKQWVKL